MVDKYLDKKLHDKIKREADKIFEKNSAYKSMYINKEYKKAGGKVKSDKKDNLSRWRRERWVNLSPYVEGLTNDIKKYECGERPENQKGNSICRPSVKVNKDTPKLAQNFTKSQIKKAYEIKQKNKRIMWEKL
jgi:hypothetical protein